MVKPFQPIYLFVVFVSACGQRDGSVQDVTPKRQPITFKSVLLKQIKSSDPDLKIVETCFYVHTWMINKTHHCYVIANSDDPSRLTARELKLRYMFQQLVQRDRRDKKLVADCFWNHRFDNYAPCWGISWGGRDLLRNVKLTFREARIRQIWNELVNEDFKREMRCIYHPWIDYEDC